MRTDLKSRELQPSISIYVPNRSLSKYLKSDTYLTELGVDNYRGVTRLDRESYPADITVLQRSLGFVEIGIELADRYIYNTPIVPSPFGY